MTFEEAVEVLGGPLEPTRDELKNGWNTETLSIYHAERHMSASDAVLNPTPPKPIKTTNALKWA